MPEQEGHSHVDGRVEDACPSYGMLSCCLAPNSSIINGRAAMHVPRQAKRMPCIQYFGLLAILLYEGLALVRVPVHVSQETNLFKLPFTDTKCMLLSPPLSSSILDFPLLFVGQKAQSQHQRHLEAYGPRLGQVTAAWSWGLSVNTTEGFCV